MAARTLQVFTTDELTMLIGLDPKKDKRRVIKFAESREYNIVPSIKLASGSGSRRLYDLENVCEFALALHLLETGLRSKVIGRVIRELRRKGRLSAKLEMEGSQLENLKLVIARTPQPGKPLSEKRNQVVNFREGGEKLTEFIAKAFSNPSNGFDMILVPIGPTFYELKNRLFLLRPEWALENL
jgi:hypothetical protein